MVPHGTAGIGLCPSFAKQFRCSGFLTIWSCPCEGHMGGHSLWGTFHQATAGSPSSGLTVCELHAQAAAWRQPGGNQKVSAARAAVAVAVAGVVKRGQSPITSTHANHFSCHRDFEGDLLELPRHQLSISTRRSLPRTTASVSPISPGDLETFAFFPPQQNQLLRRNQSRWLPQSRVLCPPTSSLATPLATATRLSLPASTMARPDRTWLVLAPNLKNALSLPFTL